MFFSSQWVGVGLLRVPFWWRKRGRKGDTHHFRGSLLSKGKTDGLPTANHARSAICDSLTLLTLCCEPQVPRVSFCELRTLPKNHDGSQKLAVRTIRILLQTAYPIYFALINTHFEGCCHKCAYSFCPFSLRRDNAGCLF